MMWMYFIQKYQNKINKVNHFGIPYIGLENNIGIGQGFIRTVNFVQTDNVMVLEHDWKLIEDKQTTIERIKSGIDLINNGYDCIRYRHRKELGHPHFSFKYQGRELDYYDKEIECTSLSPIRFSTLV